MESQAVHRVLWVWTASELVALLVGFGLGASSFTGDPPLFVAELDTLPPQLRAGLLGFIVIELLIPLWVYLDRHRSRSRSKRGVFWVHVAAMPGLDLFGVLASLQERPRLRSCSTAEADDHERYGSDASIPTARRPNSSAPRPRSALSNAGTHPLFFRPGLGRLIKDHGSGSH